MPEKGHVSYTDEEKRRKRMKWAAYIAAFVVFQTGVILVFALVVMKVRTPKFRVGNLEITSLTTPNNNTDFDIKAIAPIRIKNNNFGPYKYDATTVNFTSGGVMVGQAAVPKGKAGFMGTKKVNVNVTLSSDGLTVPSIGTEISAGLLTVESVGTMNGKVEMMWIFKKKKAIHMNCKILIIVSSKTVQSITCD